VFFYCVLEGLRGKAGNAEGEVTWNLLADYVMREVPRVLAKVMGAGARQEPRLLTNLSGSSPVLVRVPKGRE
jgi:hypothetical protein